MNQRQKRDKNKNSLVNTLKEKTVGIAYAKIKRGKEHSDWIMVKISTSLEFG
jgi:hypothetical protein